MASGSQVMVREALRFLFGGSHPVQQPSLHDPKLKQRVSTVYRQHALRLHPDKNKDDADAQQKFQMLTAYRDIVLDFINKREEAGLLGSQHESSVAQSGRGVRGGFPPGTSGEGGRGAGMRQRNAEERERERDPPWANPLRWSPEDPWLDTVKAGLRFFPGHAELSSLKTEEKRYLSEISQLWAIWFCRECELTCVRIKKEKAECLCGHSLKRHDPGADFGCAHNKCPCKRFDWVVQNNAWKVKCGCKHPHTEHLPEPPFACKKQKCDCEGFRSPFVCNCGHPHGSHMTAFVLAPFHPRGREWVVHALRPETVAIAKAYREKLQQQQHNPLGQNRPTRVTTPPRRPLPSTHSPIVSTPKNAQGPSTFDASPLLSRRRSKEAASARRDQPTAAEGRDPPGEGAREERLSVSLLLPQPALGCPAAGKKDGGGRDGEEAAASLHTSGSTCASASSSACQRGFPTELSGRREASVKDKSKERDAKGGETEKAEDAQRNESASNLSGRPRQRDRAMAFVSAQYRHSSSARLPGRAAHVKADVHAGLRRVQKDDPSVDPGSDAGKIGHKFSKAKACVLQNQNVSHFHERDLWREDSNKRY
uniref:Protein FAM221A n=1 Tax=Chromera velia CCMP2878 TaxID=1169474 RepID=A0A0G4GMU9_9ALVE|eukprot:Cvel_22606.t1-p1 / transcript=Cvel_22606.t1 / gene=Cvel_22606 / organism=Chromera_velia_CCMP2878 / gene_product=Protein FAM221A, putative / transcript_product=Protein FAM221A, putative / location=Cvel_scaffold2238:15695-20080(-) / protein_length=593 / sequence_SO=supercontig / SO=protein_coding / is_pseudo=false